MTKSNAATTVGSLTKTVRETSEDVIHEDDADEKKFGTFLGQINRK